MSLPSPVFTGSQGCGSEYAFNAQLIFLSLHIFYNLFQLSEVVDLIHACCLSAVQCEVLLHDSVVINDTITLYYVRDSVYTTVFAGDCQALIH